GVRPDAAPVRWARSQRARIWSELELGMSLQAAPWALITGTNGKTTTCHLLAEILRDKRSCEICGNSGISVCRSLLDKGPNVMRVVEASSFQLKFSRRMKPDVAVLLNLSPNHLDWHPTLRDYYEAKVKVIRWLLAECALVFNAGDARLEREAGRARCRRMSFGSEAESPGVCFKSGRLVIRRGANRHVILRFRSIALKGEHNRRNVEAAAAAALCLGASTQSIAKAVGAFKPLVHRIEDVGAYGGVSFVNDSKSTTARSTAAALEAVGKNVILMAGGIAKEKRYRDLVPELKKRVDRVVLYGRSAPFLDRELSGFDARTVCSGFEEAFRAAAAGARKGQTVLLSPMCSSFDQFKSFEERGEAFRRLVRKVRTSS
ncbi:MAG: UDP-N-acetylmuramoyl-L-alanine--D-glutamate ligase, partial [Candidatus Omnitrophica bacterium]|nr:UDP-N-acetylmuramoyl-L-alanine--D-glutamate ligase [Candidatus Omnitrophota bacterium]